MRKLMILRASSTQLPAILRAKEMGLHVIAVDSNPQAPGFAYADEKLVISAIDVPAVVEAAMRTRPDGVLTLCTDMPVRTVAAVADALGLPAIGVEDSFRATDKLAMREALRRHGVPIPLFFHAHDKSEFLQAVHEVTDRGYRCIVKPADNCGSRGVTLLEDTSAGALKEAYAYSTAYSTSGDVVVEEYMEGPELCVETLNYHGVCHPIQITDKLTTGAPYFVEMGHSQPSCLPPDVQDAIRSVAIACNEALGNTDGSSCTEIKVTKDGPKVVEMGARLAGDYMTTDLVPLSCGVSMVDGIIHAALGEEPDWEHKFERASAIRFLGAKKGTVTSIEGVEDAERVEGVVRVGIDCNVGDATDVIRNSADRVGYAIAQADTPQEAIAACEQALKMIHVSVR